MNRKRSIISADEKLKGARIVITAGEPLPGRKSVLKADEHMWSRKALSIGKDLKNMRLKGGGIAEKTGSLALKAGETAIKTGEKLKWAGKNIYRYAEQNLDAAGSRENQDEAQLFYDPAGIVGRLAQKIAQKAGDTAVKAAGRATSKAAGAATSKAAAAVKTRIKAAWKAKRTAKRMISMHAGKNARTAKMSMPVKIAKTAFKDTMPAPATAMPAVIGAGIAMLLIAASWQILVVAALPAAPLSWLDPETGEAVEQPLEDYLGEHVPLLKDAFIAELQEREDALRSEGYNHIMIWNMAGASLGETVEPSNIRDPDCGLASDEEYIDILRPVYNACLLAAYGDAYTQEEAEAVVKELFELITYCVEQPLNDIDGDGTGDYLYCDGEIYADNTAYSCCAFYRDSIGRVHTWPGCYGGTCWNSESSWRTHEDPDPDANACCASWKSCPGHALAEGEEAKFWHSNVGYCTNPITNSACYGYKMCYGHKEISIIIGNGDADELLNKYFLEPIAELEAKDSLTAEEAARLESLRSWYEMAKSSLDNPDITQ